jgi:exportin-1
MTLIQVMCGDVLKERTDDSNAPSSFALQILKQEWPHRWPTFIPDIVSSSRTSLSICENNMAILRLLSEEIFDYSAEQMTQVKTKNLKNQMCGEFSEVFQLCSEVLEKAQKPSLIKATLETMLKFLNWIPLGYIFETNVIDHLIGRVSIADYNCDDFSTDCLSCAVPRGARVSKCHTQVPV